MSTSARLQLGCFRLNFKHKKLVILISKAVIKNQFLDQSKKTMKKSLPKQIVYFLGKQSVHIFRYRVHFAKQSYFTFGHVRIELNWNTE
ncbi:hypothetical protein BAR24_10035 [Gluconobacter oxydans]|nr:hypothetical protein BAR24_10035 [Gluconobacter oxydans]